MIEELKTPRIRVEIADVTEYYEHIARHCDATLHVFGLWFGRICFANSVTIDSLSFIVGPSRSAFDRCTLLQCARRGRR